MEESVLEREYIWRPQPRQAEALACPASEVFFGGAKGGGKSDYLLGDYLADYEEWGEAWKGILFRRSYKELDEIIGRSRQVIGKIQGATYVGGDQMLWRIPAPNSRFPGFATLRFRSLDSDLRVAVLWFRDPSGQLVNAYVAKRGDGRVVSVKVPMPSSPLCEECHL